MIASCGCLLFLSSSRGLFCCCCDYSSLYLEVDGDVGCGVKRKYSEDDDTGQADELHEALLNTCINKLSTVMADGLRRRRTLHHTVLISNMLRSLERGSRPHDAEPRSHRARITARRHSSDTCPSATKLGNSDSLSFTSAELSASSEVNKYQLQSQESWKHQQSLQQPLLSWEHREQLEKLSSPWEPQHQLELVASSVEMDNSEVMSSPTATFCPLLAVDLTSGMVSPVSGVDTSQSSSELHTLDISYDCSFYITDLQCSDHVPCYKTSGLCSSVSVPDTVCLVGVSDNKRTLNSCL